MPFVVEPFGASIAQARLRTYRLRVAESKHEATVEQILERFDS
jgi:hypothetical protein